MTPTALTVLLVEDDDVVRTSMCFALANAQISVIEAGSVAEGRQRFQQGGCDVVVIDLHLPDGTGFELAEWLRRQRPRLPMVMISTDPGDTPRQLARGSCTMLAKPFSASALLDAISRVATAPGNAHG